MYVYKHKEDYAMLWIHVDGGVLVTRNNNIRDKLKLKLTEKMKLIWDEDINSIVGIEIKREANSFILKKPRLIKKLVKAADSQPLPEIKLESSPESKIDPHYLLAIGMILYLAQATRPDIMYAVNYLARFAMNSQHNNWKALRHLVDFINTTKHQTLKVRVDNTRRNVEVYVDTNWGGEGSRSQHGFCIVLYGTMVAWSSKRKSCIASSIC
ncbi:hypothetical protein O181_027993 [Austropuccinia psidii MF-1]|uniref:Reverse transcriptase Ty1/copia-type domain-containing protein n=1 Tax=Austropuccinia psidii MF-1 TaxID=1389203 RepID=A0A9Q3CSV2_9BASI|nr:hypothetical protein [Austropuccinia psidii MF-1]